MMLRFILDAARTHKCSLTVVVFLLLQGLQFSGQKGYPCHYGVPDPVVTDVMQLYHGSTAAVLTRFGLTETFDTTSGVLQGPVASYLYPAGRLHSQAITRR